MILGWWLVKKDWVVASNIFYFHPYLGKCSNLTIIFQMGWNHQLEKDFSQQTKPVGAVLFSWIVFSIFLGGETERLKFFFFFFWGGGRSRKIAAKICSEASSSFLNNAQSCSDSWWYCRTENRWKQGVVLFFRCVLIMHWDFLGRNTFKKTCCLRHTLIFDHFVLKSFWKPWPPCPANWKWRP